MDEGLVGTNGQRAKGISIGKHRQGNLQEAIGKLEIYDNKSGE